MPEINMDIIKEREGGKLDFKEYYGFMTPRGDNIADADWKKYVDGQWDEFCKDVIALSNGDLTFNPSSALIVIGVSEENGSKILKGISNLEISEDKIIKKLNEKCYPAITDVKLHYIGDDIKLCVIEIPYTAKLLESSKEFRIYSLLRENDRYIAREKRHYSRFCVFYRVGENTEIASLVVKDFLNYIKSGSAEFKREKVINEIERNLQFLLQEKNGNVVLDPVAIYNIIQNKVKFSLNGNTEIESHYARWIFLVIMILPRNINMLKHDYLFDSLQDLSFRNYLLYNCGNIDVMEDAISNLEIRYSQLSNNSESISKSAYEIVAKIPKEGKEMVLIDSKKLLSCALGLYRVSDLIKIYIGIISYLNGDSMYLKSNAISPFYLTEDEEDNKVGIDAVRAYINKTIST